MKRLLFICLLVCLSCNEAIDVGKCLLKIPGYTEGVQEVVDSIKTKNIRLVYTSVLKVFENFKDAAINCINISHNLNGLICKHPIKNFQCLIECGLPDDSPRYCNCYKKCRDEFCL